MKDLSKHKRVPLVWNGKRYSSIMDFEDEHDLSNGFTRQYIKKQKPFRGHLIYKA